MGAPRPDKKTLEEFIKHYNLESAEEKERLYKNYLFAQKELDRKKKQYHKKREAFLANTPPELRPKPGRPRNIREENIMLKEKTEENQKLQEQIQEEQKQKVSLQEELETLRKKIEELEKQKKPEKVHVQPPPPVNPYKVLTDTKGKKNKQSN